MNEFQKEIVEMRKRVLESTAIPEWIMRGYKSRLDWAMTELAMTDEESETRLNRYLSSYALGTNVFCAIVDEANFYTKYAAESCFIATASCKRDLQAHAKILGQLDSSGREDSSDNLSEEDTSAGVHRGSLG